LIFSTLACGKNVGAAEVILSKWSRSYVGFLADFSLIVDLFADEVFRIEMWFLIRQSGMTLTNSMPINPKNLLR